MRKLCIWDYFILCAKICWTCAENHHVRSLKLHLTKFLDVVISGNLSKQGSIPATVKRITLPEITLEEWH